MDPVAATGSRFDMTEASFGIGTLAKATGTKVETVRWYERVGLLPAPARTSGNYRAYGPSHLARLSFIRARDLGFSLEQVRVLLDLAEDRNRSCETVDAIAREHLTEVDRKIRDLQALRRELDGLLSQCRHGRVSECRIIEALAPPA
jgi:Cu(I)-responsive transcriptional regulator